MRTTRHRLKRLLPAAMLLSSAHYLQAQVTIGSGIEPRRAALLDLKTRQGVANITSVTDDDNVTSEAGGLLLPQNYQRAGRLSIRGYGKIWNIVINGNEQACVNEPDAGEAETTFDGSPENSYLLDALARQNKIISEYVEVSGRLQNQNPSYILAPPEQRMQALDNEYKAFRKEINDSPLYAARIVEILNCLSGTGSSFILN